MTLQDFINLLPDAKIQTISFDFDAKNIQHSQDLVIIVSKLQEQIEQYQLFFSNTSSFNVRVAVGEQSVYPINYEGDSMYIASVLCKEKVKQHQHWQIQLIGKVGCIDIFADELNITKI
ncbi:MAG: hypothetical protein ACFNP4_06235 [Capnocytophaga gingivalis]|uniref:hypothetical protein n=1 Tax=Capnocytophaga gingivalis TaxID=1017 RepID=UPI0036186433